MSLCRLDGGGRAACAGLVEASWSHGSVLAMYEAAREQAKVMRLLQEAVIAIPYGGVGRLAEAFTSATRSIMRLREKAIQNTCAVCKFVVIK